MRSTWFGTIAVVATLLVAGAASVPAQEEGGCIARGSGPTVLDGSCQYIALDESQSVIPITTDRWEIVVVRQCPYSTDFQCKPPRLEDGCSVDMDENTCPLAEDENGNLDLSDRKVILLAGEGLEPDRQPLEVHPFTGEIVDVRILLPESGGGSNGLLIVGFEDQNGLPDPPL